MRVALTTYNARAGDAVGNHVAEKLAFFLERGADVRVFLEDDRDLHPAVRPHAATLRGPEPKGEAWRFLSSADLVLVDYAQHYALLGLLPLLAGGKPRLLFDYHGVTPAEWWGSHNREALDEGARQRGLVWCADQALVHSRFTGRELRDHTGFPAERVRALGYPVAAGRFTPGPPVYHLRDQLNLGRASVVLFVGRLAVNKRAPLLVDALDRLRDLDPPVHVVLVGDDRDLYQLEARRCRERAAELGLGDRVHLLGHVRDECLLDAYRSADVFVMPSRHEGFCLPLVEAMACGVPVVAARAGALPETVGNAGLTFAPDDAEDLARQLRRVLTSIPPDGTQPAPVGAYRVAVVTFRYGGDFVGGAEVSLRTMARVLHGAGHAVEVFATCTRAESHWTNDLPEGTTADGGIPVHRFRLDVHDPARHGEAFRAVLEADGPPAPGVEREYLAHSVRSGRLLEALGRRREEFDAILVGPYLFGLTLDVARAFPERTLLIPCFHDEPLARLPAWRAYEQVGGVLYHSPEEQQFAEIDLGLNHPGAICVGTWLDTAAGGDPEEGRRAVGTGRRYVVYCGRYSRQKNVPLLLDHARRYAAEHPERYTFVFVGQGDVAVPPEPWARDLGFLPEGRKRDVLAGADALVQLSTAESLSLVALEAWAEGTPVIGHAACAVLAGQLARARGGRAVTDYATFAAALDDLWERPGDWQTLGRQGQKYVRDRYGAGDGFLAALEQAVAELRLPLVERLRRRGLERAARFDRARWREEFGRLVEDLLDAPARPYEERVEVRPRAAERAVTAGGGSVLVPVRVVNRGTHPLPADGPGRVVLRSEVFDADGRPCGRPGDGVPLPRLLAPGRALSATVPVPVPCAPGAYRVVFAAVRADGGSMPESVPCPRPTAGEAALRLTVEGGTLPSRPGCCAPLLETVEAAVAEAERRQRLPDDYLDVTEGWFAAWKRWVKRKLLGNFKRAYVDVLSRQQSAFNRQLVGAVRELAECCALLDHAAAAERPAEGNDLAGLVRDLARELAETRRRLAEVEERLARREAEAGFREQVPSE